MRIVLAPMEGVMDGLMREVLTDLGGIDLCISEFIRVTNRLLPNRTFYRLCPELHQQGKTASGVPTRAQLLGHSPQWLAENANRAVSLGSFGIDLNFGCPAKQVNQSKGGAILLKEPEQIFCIVQEVRHAVPKEQPVSAKIRLGYDCKTRTLEIADAVQQAGATEITVHGRTKEEGYQTNKIDWDAIAAVKNTLAIPVIANGEIWSATDAIRCIEKSNCTDLMIGRGALALPNLASTIKDSDTPLSWPDMVKLLSDYSLKEISGEKAIYFPNRIKQWFRYLMLQYPEAKAQFSIIRSIKEPQHIIDKLTESSMSV